MLCFVKEISFGILKKGCHCKEEVEVVSHFVWFFSVTHLKAFDGSIGKDGHLAVAFFQRGVAFYKKEK